MIGEAPPRSPKKVLIVEDNALNLKLLYDILEYHGYLVLTTGRGQEAAEIAQQHQPDFAVEPGPPFGPLGCTRYARLVLRRAWRTSSG
jgi:hypothetical protein